MKYEQCTLGKLKYLMRYPDGFEHEEKYPLIICLHGAGYRGGDYERVMANPYFKETEKQENFPFVMAAPICSEDTWFDLWGELKALVVKLASESFVDVKRIYMMGASMGGYGTWQLAMSMPEYFAAIAPICGGGMYWNAGRLINVPVWAFHGALDQAVFPEESRKMVDAVNKKGGQAKLTMYPENGHNAWSDTYSNPELYRWFLQHENTNALELINEYSDAEAFG